MNEIPELVVLIATSLGALVGIGGLIYQGIKIMHELKPNSGGSLRDQVDLLHELVRSQGHQIGQIRADLIRMDARHDADVNRLIGK